MSTGKKCLFLGDILIAIAIVIGCFMVGMELYAPSQSTHTAVIITVDGKEYGCFPLDTDAKIPVGDTGMLVCIQNGSCTVEASDCPDEICMSSGALNEDTPRGKSLVCLPNHVVISLDGQSVSESEVATVAG